MADPEDYKCPCCLNFIYNNYKCSNNHNTCHECHMKISYCPICRDDKIIKSKIIIGNDVILKECKNRDKGCELQLYHFDDDHEVDCLYNTLHCKFCNIDINDSNFNTVMKHYSTDCINTFNILKYNYDNKGQGETSGRVFHLKNIKSELSLINFDDQYIIMIIPKLSQKKINFVVFSSQEKYKLSNYKIKILDTTKSIISEIPIYYKRMYDSSIPCDQICKSNGLLNFTVENAFLLNRKKPDHFVHNNTNFYETYSIHGEPGSAGNWTHDDYENIFSKFMGL